jgi:hypothetical protein
VIVIAIWNCICIPLQICFEPETLETTTVEVINNIIDFCFVVDIVICCRTTFYDNATGDEVFDGKRTALFYIKS